MSPLLLLLALLLPVVLLHHASSNQLVALRRGSPAISAPFSDRGKFPPSLDSVGNGRFLLVNFDGTLYSVDAQTQVVQWNLSTGSPLWHSGQALSKKDGNDYFIYPGEDWNLFEYRKDMGARELNLTVEELVHNTPQIKGSVVTVGSKTTTIYYVDADSGEVLSQNYLPGTSPAIGAPKVKEKSLSSFIEPGKNYNSIITIIRTNYFLNSSDLGKPLWSFSTSHFAAHITPKSGSELGFPYSFPVSLPVFFLHEDGNSAGAMLPQASPIVQQLPQDSEPEMSYPTGIIPVAQQNTSEASPSSEWNTGSPQIRSLKDDKRMSLNASHSSFEIETNVDGLSGELLSLVPMILPNNRGVHFSTLQNSYKAAIAFSPLVIIPLLILLGLLYMKLRESVKYDKQSIDMGGHQYITPKKRKPRKAGYVKDGSCHDRLKSSEKENANSNNNADRKSHDGYPFINLTSNDVGEGHSIGRLFVSNSEIGRGSNGTVVFEGSFNRRRVAVKRLLRAHNDVALKEIENLIASDEHPNIVRWYGVEEDLHFVYISLELCTCSLSQLIQLCSDSSSSMTCNESQMSSSISNLKGIDKNLELWRQNGFPSPQLLKLMSDVVSGLAHLHELGIIHRDLKPQNVLLRSDNFLHAKLSDMGISKRLDKDKTSVSHNATGYGSSGWQAPEQLLNGRQTRAVDLFSLGCIIFFCITKGKHPFGSHYERDSNILKNRMDLFLVDHMPEAVDLISQLLDSDPKMRPTASEVLKHPFFWSSNRRISFLRDTSDRVELEDRENESELLNDLENIAPVAFGWKWGQKLDAAFITDMGRYRRYNFDSTRDLLRLIRNKLNHYRELPKELQEILGSVPEGFDRYFASRFPKLLIEVYKVISRYCREDDCLSSYFRSCLV